MYICMFVMCVCICLCMYVCTVCTHVRRVVPNLIEQTKQVYGTTLPWHFLSLQTVTVHAKVFAKCQFCRFCGYLHMQKKFNL